MPGGSSRFAGLFVLRMFPVYFPVAGSGQELLFIITFGSNPRIAETWFSVSIVNRAVPA